MNDGARSEPANDRSEAYFEIYRVTETQLTATLWSGGGWGWRFCAPSGRTLAASAGFKTSAKCLEAVSALRERAGTANIYELP